MQPWRPQLQRGPGILLARHPRQRRVAPFAGDAVAAVEHAAARPRCRRRRRCRGSRRTPPRAPRAAPSTASDSAKQLASLAKRISLPRIFSRSCLSGRRCTACCRRSRPRRCAASIRPGMPMPTLQSLAGLLLRGEDLLGEQRRSAASYSRCGWRRAGASARRRPASSTATSIFVPPRSTPSLNEPTPASASQPGARRGRVVEPPARRARALADLDRVAAEAVDHAEAVLVGDVVAEEHRHAAGERRLAA